MISKKGGSKPMISISAQGLGAMYGDVSTWVLGTPVHSTLYRLKPQWTFYNKMFVFSIKIPAG